MIFSFDPLFADLSQFDCALGTRRHGNTIVAQLLLEHGNPWSGIALLALSDRDFGIEVGWLAAPRVPAQRTADCAA